jgi:hypothetical protein
MVLVMCSMSLNPGLWRFALHSASVSAQLKTLGDSAQEKVTGLGFEDRRKFWTSAFGALV